MRQDCADGQVGPMWQANGNQYATKWQMYLTSPQGNTTISAPYNVSVAALGPLTQAQPWVWSATVTPNGEVSGNPASEASVKRASI